METELGEQRHRLARELSSAPRPWLALYGKFLSYAKPVQQDDDEELPPIHHLPPEMMLHVLSYLPVYQLGRVACVCRAWSGLVEHPKLWEAGCRDAFQVHVEDGMDLKKHLALHRNSWKHLFLEQPHLRFDGLYVSRNTYMRAGVTEWTQHRPVHVVVYYRYYRFFPDGTLLYCTSPSTVSKVARYMSGPQSRHIRPDGSGLAHQRPGADGQHVFVGMYRIKGKNLWLVIRYPNNSSTEIRVRLNLRSTVPGANNRLDIQSIVSYDRDTHYSTDMGGNQQQQEQDGNEPQRLMQREHKRGLSPCVHVPWFDVQTSVLNLPHDKMDVFLPG